MTFADICIQDGMVTKAGELACAMIYERVTGKCAHLDIIISGGDLFCHSCRKWLDRSIKVHPLPLATSLDAWAKHIWPYFWDKNGIERSEIRYSFSDYAHALAEICGACIINEDELGPLLQKDSWWFLATAGPIMHLEAGLRYFNLYDEWEARVK